MPRQIAVMRPDVDADNEGSVRRFNGVVDRHRRLVDRLHGEIGLVRVEPREVGLRPDDREGPRIDRVAVADVVVSGHKDAASAWASRQARR